MLFLVLGYACLAFIVCVSLLAFLTLWRYMWYFYNRKCKHCGKRMEYKGFKESFTEHHFLFHCRHCGSWEQVPKEDIVRGDN